MRAIKLLPSLLGFCLLASALACGDDDDDKSGAGEATLKAECAEISDACHEADDGTGDAHECHDVAHHNDVGDCKEQRDHCLEVCAGHGEGGTHAH